jgi:hypothetical protein
VLRRRMIVMLVTAASLCLGLSLTMSAAYAAPAAPATHSIAGVSAQAKAGARTAEAAVRTAQTGSRGVAFLSPATHSSSPAGGLIPLIQFRECNGTKTTWVDLDMLSIPAGLLTDWCFGYTGRWQFTGNYNVSYFCSGNNKGGFAYDDAGVYKSFAFGPGKLIALPLNSVPVSLTITGWSGSDTCSS